MVIDIINSRDALRASVEAIELQHDEAEGTIYCQLPMAADLQPGDSIGFRDIDGRCRLFEVSNRELREPEATWEISGVDRAIRELMDCPVIEARARGISASTYVARLLDGTGYTVGTVASDNSGTMTAYYESVWSAIARATKVFNVRLIPYFIFTGGIISGRHVDILSTAGEYRGRLLELGDDLAGLSVAYDDSQIKTALIGRGRGEEIDNGDGNDPSYGRRITFADVVWSVEDGDPVDKPAGQEWVGDPDALALYGRHGMHRTGFATFEEETDPEQLLERTWAELQELTQPRISITGTVYDTERVLGHSHEAIRLGDIVIVRMRRPGPDPGLTQDITARVVAINRDYVHPEQTTVTIGNSSQTAGDIIGSLRSTVDNYESKSAVWDRANAFDLQGALDVINNAITSTAGGWYTDSSGALMFVSADGTKAMRLTGAGWQIADNKTGDAWNWRTAASGSGIVADQITTGTLNAGNVSVGGTGTTLDGTSLTVMHPDVSPAAKTVIDADGLKMMDGTTVLGGIIQTLAGYISAVQALYNPQIPQLRADIGTFNGTADTLFGIQLNHNDTPVLKLGIGEAEGTIMDAEIISTGYPIIILANSATAMSIQNANAAITLNAGGEIVFEGVRASDGRHYSFTGSEVWHLID